MGLGRAAIDAAAGRPQESREMRSVIVLALGAVVAALSACNGTGDPTGATCPPNSTLTYETFGKAFFAANCDACHGAGGDTQPRLSSQETIRRQKDDVDKAAAKGPTRPTRTCQTGAASTTKSAGSSVSGSPAARLSGGDAAYRGYLTSTDRPKVPPFALTASTITT